jgi:uncharacterized membrane protein
MLRRGGFDMTQTRLSRRLVPLWLILLMAIPVLFGILRLYWLATGAEITPENFRFFDQPLPVVVHIIGAIIYSVVGAFQFSAGIRKRFPSWHRSAGRVLFAAGLAAALSGLWMTFAYPLGDVQGPILFAIRLVVGAAMALWLVQGVLAAIDRRFGEHRAHMMRAYAIGLGAGTQVLVIAPYAIVLGQPDQVTYDLLMGFAWLLNLVIAEWVIRGGKILPRRRTQLASR